MFCMCQFICHLLSNIFIVKCYVWTLKAKDIKVEFNGQLQNRQPCNHHPDQELELARIWDTPSPFRSHPLPPPRVYHRHEAVSTDENNIKLRVVDTRLAHELSDFYIFKWLEKIRRRTVFHDMKIYEIQMSGPTNKALLEQNHASSSIYYLWLLLCYKAELSNRDRGCMSHKTKKTYDLAFYRKSLPTPI